MITVHAAGDVRHGDCLINNTSTTSGPVCHCRHMAFNTGNGITQTIKSGTTDNSNHCDICIQLTSYSLFWPTVQEDGGDIVYKVSHHV